MKSFANAIVISAAIIATLPASCTSAHAQAYPAPAQTRDYSGDSVQRACSSLMDTLLKKYGRTFICIEIRNWQMPNYTERSGNIAVTDNTTQPQAQRIQMHFNTMSDPADPNAYTYSMQEYRMVESLVQQGRGLTRNQLVDAAVDMNKDILKRQWEMYSTMQGADPRQLKERKKYYEDGIKQLEAMRSKLHGYSQ